MGKLRVSSVVRREFFGVMLVMTMVELANVGSSMVDGLMAGRLLGSVELAAFGIAGAYYVSYEYSAPHKTYKCLMGSAGLLLELGNDPEPLFRLGMTGTRYSLGDGKYLLYDDETPGLALTIYPHIDVIYFGDGEQEVIDPQTMVDAEGMVSVTVPAGYVVDESFEEAYTILSVSVETSEKDGAMLTYVLDVQNAIDIGVDNIEVAVEKIPETGTLSDDADKLLDKDPYDGGYEPLLTDGDTVPSTGGWLLVRAGYGVNVEKSAGGLVEFIGYHSGGYGSEIYRLYYVYPTTASGNVTIVLNEDATTAHWLKLTVNNPGGRKLTLAYEADEYTSFDFSDKTLTKDLVIEGDYLLLMGDSGLAKSDITAEKGVKSVTETDVDHVFHLALADGATEVVISVKAPANSGTAGGNNSNANGSPKTGDDTSLGLWAALLALSCAGLGAVALRTGKRRQSK